MKVIISADDFGYSIACNEAIDSLIRAGKVTSTSIMTNGPAFEDALERIRDLPAAVNNTVCSFGVHLNITEFEPLSSSWVLNNSGIVNRDGLFTMQVRHSPPSLALMKAIEQEWHAQIKRVLDLGISISHLDSHHHVHTIPWLFPALKRIQIRQRVKRMRISTNWYYKAEYSPSNLTTLGKKAWIWSLRNIYKTVTTDSLTDFKWFIANLRDGNKANCRVVEVVCHPGHSWAASETELLWSDWMKDLPYSIELISFNDL